MIKHRNVPRSMLHNFGIVQVNQGLRLDSFVSNKKYEQGQHHRKDREHRNSTA